VPPITFEFVLTPLVKLHEGRPHQVCRVHLPDGLGDDAILELIRNGERFAWSGDELRGDLLVPEATVPATGQATLTSGDATRTVDVAFAPVRRWRVFLVNHSHTDIGFTHTYRDCIEIHVKNLRLALEMIEVTAGWPSDSRMRWTVESAWQLQHYLQAYPEDRQRIAAAVRAGLLEIEALYIHSYFDILSREQLVRSLTYAEDIRHELDIPITSAMICDVPGCSWSLVDLLAASDIPYLAMAPNNFIAPFHAQTNLERPFIWQGPAGGRVTVWFTGDPSWAYIEGARLGFWDSLATVEERLPARLQEMAADDYPYDLVQFQLGSDNRPLRLLPASIAREWNATYLSPKIEIATTSQFFRSMEARYGDRFPVVSGEWQSSWSETSLHYPHEAALSRRNHHTLRDWEGFAAIGAWMNEAYSPPQQAIDDAFDASLLFDEHGGPKGIWLPRSEDEALAAIVQGYEIFEAQTIPASVGREAALAAATGAQRTGDDPVAVVWNLCPWVRSGPVEIDAPSGTTVMRAIDEVTGSPAPVASASDRVVLHVSDVPAFGYRRYRLTTEPGDTVDWPVLPPAIETGEGAATLVNDRLSVQVDASGHITSLVERVSGRELIDSSQWPGGNAFTRYRTAPHGPGLGGDFNADRRLYDGVPIEGWVVEPGHVETRDVVTSASPGVARIETSAEIDGSYRWESVVTLHPDWLEIRNRLSWLDLPPDPEMLYVVFPFALNQPEIRHASQFVIVDPRRQTLSGSNHDTFAIQEWVDVSASDAGVTVTSDDLPLVDYGGINMRQFKRQVEPERGVLAFRAAALHNAPPEPGSPWGKLPYLELRFAIRPYAGPFDPMAAHRFGEEQASPLVARSLPPRHPGEWRQPSAGFVAIESESGLIVGLKPARDGRGVILRIWESAGRRTVVRLLFPQHNLLAAWSTTPGEHDLNRLAIADSALVFELEKFRLITIRCQVGR
jgi:hypothetical protein